MQEREVCDNIYFYYILNPIFTMNSTLSKLEPCLFPYFIRFLLINWLLVF